MKGEIALALDDFGTGKVLIDGIDHAKWATSISTRSQAGEGTTVTIEYRLDHVSGSVNGTYTHVVLFGPFRGEGSTPVAALDDLLRVVSLQEALGLNI